MVSVAREVGELGTHNSLEKWMTRPSRGAAVVNSTVGGKGTKVPDR